MTDVPTLVGTILSFFGALFFLASAIGVVRLPDIYCRMHAPTKAATVGLALFALGSLVQGLFGGDRARFYWLEDILLLTVVFITLPVSAEALARSARRRGIGIDRRAGSTSTPSDKGNE